MHDVNEDEKKHMVFYHNEKLAIAFGIINVPFGTPIRVIKNLHMCGDFHTATKCMSKIVRCEIIVRDANSLLSLLGWRVLLWSLLVMLSARYKHRPTYYQS